MGTRSITTIIDHQWDKPERLSKDAWYRHGGFANPRLFRRGCGDGWTYWSM